MNSGDGAARTESTAVDRDRPLNPRPHKKQTPHGAGFVVS